MWGEERVSGKNVDVGEWYVTQKWGVFLWEGAEQETKVISDVSEQSGAFLVQVIRMILKKTT